MKPEYLDELIDRASKVAGSDSELARQLEVSRSFVSDWRNNRKKCPAADQALMAHIAGLDADAWGSRALISQHAGTTKGAKLEAALKKALLATGAALASGGAQAAIATEPFHQAISYFIRCIFCKLKVYKLAN